MNLKKHLKSLQKASKLDDIPGTVAENTNKPCPTGCGGKLKIMNPCCSIKKYKERCNCGYEAILANYSR